MPDRCGDCQRWMCCTCPREANVKGYSRGPNCGGIACSEFLRKVTSVRMATSMPSASKELAEMVATSPLFAHFREEG